MGWIPVQTFQTKLIRRCILSCVVMIGLSTAILERARPDIMDPWWEYGNEMISTVLNPVRQQTHSFVVLAERLSDFPQLLERDRKLTQDATMFANQLNFLSEEISRLNRLLGLHEWSGPPSLTFLPSSVIGLADTDDNAALLIDRGVNDKVHVTDPVVALDGLLGVVEQVFATNARVQLITDPTMVIGVLDHETRSRGVVYGRGRNKPLAFMPEDGESPVAVGSTLITSGFQDSIYPKGIVVGKIESVDINESGISYGVVNPSVNIAALEEVLLILPVSRFAGVDEVKALGGLQIVMPNVEDSSTTAIQDHSIIPGRELNAPAIVKISTTTSSTLSHEIHLSADSNLTTAPIALSPPSEDRSTTRVLVLPPYIPEANTTPTQSVNPSVSLKVLTPSTSAATPKPQNLPKKTPHPVATSPAVIPEVREDFLR